MEKKIYAVVWANSNPEKYWYKVFKDLIDFWRNVIPVNPDEPEVLWIKTYPRLTDYIWSIDTAIFVTQPVVSEKVLQDVLSAGVKNARFQPGSESQKCIDFCIKNAINYTANACIMVRKLGL